jgi:hypothetical protein
MAKTFEKYYNKKGEVAVLYSPGYGAGWYSWNSDEPGLLFDKDIVEAVLNKDFKKACMIAENKYDAYAGGADNLIIWWATPGDKFVINEYDGSESIKFLGNVHYNIA